MWSWIEDIVDAIKECFLDLLDEATQTIFDRFMQWIYEKIFSAVGNFFELIGNMGAEIFEYDWIKATVMLFTMLAWALYVCGLVVAVFDCAMQYQNGANGFKNLFLNSIKGFFACSLIGTVPIKLYQFCISLQGTFFDELAAVFGASQELGIKEFTMSVFDASFGVAAWTILMLPMMIAFVYCVVKIFFQNMMRGGILLTEIAIGSLYMFSVPRGYVDGFKSWMKQVIAICATSFLQTTLLYLGLMTFSENMVYGLGIMFAAKEVPRICQQFGLDTSVNVGNIVNQAMTTVRVTNMVKHAVSKSAN